MADKMLKDLPELSDVTEVYELLTWSGNNAAGKMPISALLNVIGGGVVDASVGESGYIKLKNGLIMQWGHVASQTNGVEIPFHIPFTKDYMAMTAHNNSDGNWLVCTESKKIDNSKFKAWTCGCNIGGGSTTWSFTSNMDITWLAVGK